MNQNLYVGIWKEYLSSILLEMQGKGNGSIQLDSERFYKAGDRKSYSFRLDINEGNIPLKKGNAVARDLKYVLDDSNKFASLAKGIPLVIRMDNNFCLHVIRG